MAYDNSGVLREPTKEELEVFQRTDNVQGFFYVGQKLEINGGFFQVKSVTPKKLILKVLPKP